MTFGCNLFHMLSVNNMMEKMFAVALLNCVVWLAVVGVMGFLVGRLLPAKWITPDKGLFRCLAFEKNGRFYEKLGIRKWHKRLPDMSRILPFLIPAKNMRGAYKDRLDVMIHETCVAEVIHHIMNFCALRCLKLWPGMGGICVALLYIMLNLPFILIQRYNRPRLVHLQKRLKKHQEADQQAYAYCN